MQDKIYRTVHLDYVDPDRMNIFWEKEGLNDLNLDYRGLPPKKREGAACKMLAASALYCLAGTLAAALNAREVPITTLRGKASSVVTNDARQVVEAIEVEIELGVEEGHEEAVARVERFLPRACLISRSLAPGIEVREKIIRV